MKKKLKDIMVMIPGKIKKHKKLTAVLLALFVAVGVFSGRWVLTRKAKGEDPYCGKCICRYILKHISGHLNDISYIFGCSGDYFRIISCE